MEIKALFFDVDGTLVSFDTHRVPQSAVEALRQAHASGIKIIIATGRPYTDLHELEGFPFDAIVALNGAECVLRGGTPVSCNQIPFDDFMKVKEMADKYDFVLGIETNDGVYVNKLDKAVTDLAQLVAHPVPLVVDLEQKFKETPCCQMCIYCDEQVEREVLRRVPGLSPSRWNPLFTDLNVAGTSKAAGIERFCSYYGFEISQTAAFGDGGNDISMLRAAGCGVAMGGASDTVKAAADYVTTTVDENGVKKALLHLGVVSE